MAEKTKKGPRERGFVEEKGPQQEKEPVVRRRSSRRTGRKTRGKATKDKIDQKFKHTTKCGD